MISSVNYDFILLVDIYFQCHLFPKTTHQPEIEDLTHSWLLNVHYIKVALELLKGSINPVLFGTHYLKLIQFNSNITSKTTWRITSSQVNLVLLSLALLYLSLVSTVFTFMKVFICGLGTQPLWPKLFNPRKQTLSYFNCDFCNFQYQCIRNVNEINHQWCFLLHLLHLPVLCGGSWAGL